MIKTSKHEFKFTDFPEQTLLCKMFKGLDVKGNIPEDLSAEKPQGE